MTSLDLVLGIAIGLGVAAAVFGANRWILRRRRDSGAVPNGIGGGPTRSTSTPVSGPDPPNSSVDVPVASGAHEDSGGPAPPGTSPQALEIVRAESPVHPSPLSPSIRVPEATLQLSHRVILHLFGQGVFRPDEVAPRALSQAGIIDVLQIRQGALAGVLRRLEAAQVVRSETAHIQGGRRRVKVYHLTDRGRQLARELRSKSPSTVGGKTKT